ncbi:hypothetical protein NC661_13160 [Aquibacillus koreensis]|uniref:Uncharacterized protein n=1 Tax=Aquibacillus koreensis TaxID=279446 RepID=A0A9X3WQ02_9BACI|nr:hypothetical protein [Aquibacillus koreensis]MCT2536330.1 hypothetical protein [Aquibacillus koreensis]MDC3421319.1 hypothetical protein [Aquibacillus koreensis]
MIKVKMLVQTTYNGQILRQGKVYEVAKDTAERWHISNIATLIEEEESK